MATEQAADSGARRRPKGRSPSYPGISLRTAVGRARLVYEKEGRHAAPDSANTGHCGINSPTTAPPTHTYTALVKIGLLEAEGTGRDRTGKLTPLALDILLNPEPLPAIQKAALLPPIHREMWEHYGYSLPSDENLRYRMVAQGGFTETGFQEFIRQYRDTIAFAQLPSADSLNGETDPSGGQDDDHKAQLPPDDLLPPPPKDRRGGVSGNVLTIPIPIVGSKQVTIEGEFPISEAAWTQFLAVLNAMKPGLVRDPEPGNAE